MSGHREAEWGEKGDIEERERIKKERNRRERQHRRDRIVGEMDEKHKSERRLKQKYNIGQFICSLRRM